eukprot:3935636-Pyramimonas_sp.AAC.3
MVSPLERPRTGAHSLGDWPHVGNMPLVDSSHWSICGIFPSEDSALAIRVATAGEFGVDELLLNIVAVVAAGGIEPPPQQTSPSDPNPNKRRRKLEYDGGKLPESVYTRRGSQSHHMAGYIPGGGANHTTGQGISDAAGEVSEYDAAIRLFMVRPPTSAGTTATHSLRLFRAALESSRSSPLLVSRVFCRVFRRVASAGNAEVTMTTPEEALPPEHAHFRSRRRWSWSRDSHRCAHWCSAGDGSRKDSSGERGRGGGGRARDDGRG